MTHSPLDLHWKGLPIQTLTEPPATFLIVSPGQLPNNLTIENIKNGNSNIRNPVLASFATKLLPYRGLGSGIRRAVRAYPDISFVEDREGNLFTAIIQLPRH